MTDDAPRFNDKGLPLTPVRFGKGKNAQVKYLTEAEMAGLDIRQIPRPVHRKMHPAEHLVTMTIQARKLVNPTLPASKRLSTNVKKVRAHIKALLQKETAGLDIVPEAS